MHYSAGVLVDTVTSTLVFSDFNENNVVMFYDEEDNELTFTIGDDTWLELPDEPT
jgi:hypothetical protein